MAKTGGPTDVRLRPFRIAAYGLYLLVVGSFSTVVIVSVLRSVIAMTPGRRAQSEGILSAQDCVRAAEDLWNELEQRRKDLTSRPPASEADQEWTSFRVSWLDRERETEARCKVDESARAPLRAVFRRLDKAMDLYTTHAVQYAGEVGPTADAFRRDLEAARREAR